MDRSAVTGPEAVHRQVVLPAGREEVWEALTDPARLADWFGGAVSIEPRVRGRVAVRTGEGPVRRGVVLAAARPYRLVIVWEEEPAAMGLGDSPPATTLEYTLEEHGAETKLTVKESLRLAVDFDAHPIGVPR